MTISLGLGSYALAWSIGVPTFPPPEAPMDVFDVLDFADDLGLTRVQYADNLSLEALDSEQQARLRETAERRGIVIEVGTRGSQPDHLRRWIAIAKYYRSPILRVIPDAGSDRPSPEQLIERLRAVLPDLHDAGTALAVENHDRFKARTLAAIIEAVDDPHVGICLDTANSFGALEGTEVVVAALAKHTINLHLKEFVVRRARHNMGFEITGAPAGQGMLNIPWLLETIAAYGRSLSAIIETWMPPLATMRETTQQEQDWARQSVAYLRTLIKE
jgi:sugar phosphate isomerase/epimerase